KVFVERVAIDTELDITAKTASIGVRAVLRNASTQPWQGHVAYRIEDEATGLPVLHEAEAATVALAAGESKAIELRGSTLRDPHLWHFDHPHLYLLTTEVSSGHVVATTLGIRKIEIRGTAFYLNGERVRLMGVERM